MYFYDKQSDVLTFNSKKAISNKRGASIASKLASIDSDNDKTNILSKHGSGSVKGDRY